MSENGDIDNPTPLPASVVSSRLNAAAVGILPSNSATANSEALQTAINSITGEGATVLFGEGTYLFNQLVTLKSHVTFEGRGKGSQLTFTGTGTVGAPLRFMDVATFQAVRFKNLQLTLAESAEYATLVRFSACFHGSIEDCWMNGTNGATLKAGQIAVEMDKNAGDNRIINTDIVNFGIGVKSSTVMNYLIGGAIDNCQKGVYIWEDSEWPTNAGICLSSVTIAGTNELGHAGQMTYGIQSVGGGNSIWLMDTWIEGVLTGCSIGNGEGGPGQFYWKGGRCQATETCLAIERGHEFKLEDLRLSCQAPGTKATVTYLHIGPEAPNGILNNVYINDTAENRELSANAAGTLTTVEGSNELKTVTTTTGALALGQTVVAAGVPAGAVITAISGTTVTVSQKATASASAIVYLASLFPAGWKWDLRSVGESAQTIIATNTDKTGPGVGGMTGTDYFVNFEPPTGSQGANNNTVSCRLNGGRARFYWDGHNSAGRACLAVMGAGGVLSLRVGTSSATVTDALNLSYNGGALKADLTGELAVSGKFGANGAVPVAKHAAIASPAAELAALKTAVDALRETVKNVGLTE